MASKPVMYIARGTQSWYKTGPDSFITRTTFSWFKVTGDLINIYIRPKVSQQPKMYPKLPQIHQEQDRESFPGEEIKGAQGRFDRGEALEQFITLQDEDTYPREDLETPGIEEDDSPASYSYQDKDTYPREDCEPPSNSESYKRPLHPSPKTRKHIKLPYAREVAAHTTLRNDSTQRVSESPSRRRGRKQLHPMHKNRTYLREDSEEPISRRGRGKPSQKIGTFPREESEGPSTRRNKKQTRPSITDETPSREGSEGPNTRSKTLNNTSPKEESEGSRVRRGKRSAHSLPASAVTPEEKRPRRSMRRKVNEEFE